MRYNRFCGWPRVPPPKVAVLPGYVVALSFKTPEIRTDADRIVSMCVESPGVLSTSGRVAVVSARVVLGIHLVLRQ
jgi:hypothetical protein